MKTTANFGLKKPESSDYVDVSVLSENMDTLDAEIPARYAKITHAGQHATGGADPLTPAAIGAYPNGIKGAVNCNNLSDGAWTISASATNGPGAFACTLFHKDWNADFASQIAFGADRNVYYRVKTSGSWLAWQEMYSTLRYPSPAKIGAVAKTGDTMTGTLTVQNASYPDINLKNTGSGSATKIRNSAHRTQIMSKEDDSNYRALTLHDKSATTSPLDILQIQQIEGGSQKALYKVLHTGNLSDLGIARIETGSYVGTGVYGASNPCSLTFGFVPKMVFIIKDNAQVLTGNTYGYSCTCGFLSSQLSTEYKDIMVNPRQLESMSVKLNDKTVYWYKEPTVAGSDTSGFMLNASGITYHYIAIG